MRDFIKSVLPITVMAILTIPIAFLLNACQREPAYRIITNEGVPYSEIKIEGCEYLLNGIEIAAHKGNCTNPIHKATQIIYERAVLMGTNGIDWNAIVKVNYLTNDGKSQILWEYER